MTPDAANPGGAIPGGVVAVGVCTYRRPALSHTLDTLEAQVLPPGVTLCIIVCDNDTDPTAQPRTDAFAARSRHRIVYRHAPAGNISVARNGVLDAVADLGLTRLAFIDDDELAPPGWLAALLARLAHGDADVVVGPVRAIYGADAPDWMQQLGVHDTRPELGPDGRPIAGHSCNVVLDMNAPALAGLRFDLGRGVSGGEDTAFFAAARRAGARMALAPDAWLTEQVTPARARLGWLLKRRYRMGQTHGSLLREGARPAGRAANLCLATAKAAYCGAFAIVTWPLPTRRNANLISGSLHVGAVSALLGSKPISIYGESGTKPSKPTGTRPDPP